MTGVLARLRHIFAIGRPGYLRKWGPWVGGTVILAAAALIVYFATGVEASVTSRARAVDATDITEGPSDAKTVIVEYSDFECRFCAGYSQILGALRDEYKDQVLFVFRFFPLENHPHGMISAQAAYAASLQGRFWEMHDLLFQEQEAWTGATDPTTYFDSYAQALGLDMDKFRTDMKAAATLAFISAQKAEGKASGVEHTPWFVIDGMVVAPRNIEEFRRLIEKTP
jgi:protein-disulfide isomerase